MVTEIFLQKMIGNVETFLIYRKRDESFRDFSFNNLSNTKKKKNGLAIKCKPTALAMCLTLSLNGFVYGHENWSRILEDENSIRVIVKRVTKRIMGRGRESDQGVESVATNKHFIQTQVQQTEVNTSYKHKFSKQN